MNRHRRYVREGLQGVGEIFKEFFDKASDIIREAGQSRLALASLIVVVLGLVVAFLFRNDSGKLKLAAFTSFLGFLVFVVVLASNSTKPDTPTSVPTKIDNSERKPGTSEAQP